MRCYPIPMTVDQISRRRRDIDPRPQYQRSPIWNVSKRQLLIDTILRNYDMPKFYLRRLPPDAQHDWEVVDGQQRLRAIWDFLEDGFELSEASGDLPDLGNLTGKNYSDLSHDAKDRLHGSALAVIEIQDASESEIRDLFLRLQEGVPLNPAEKRHAMLGSMRDFVAELAGEGGVVHPVFPLLRVKNDRYQWEDWLAHALRLELAGGPADIKATDLKTMYEAETTFDSAGGVARKVKRILNYMARVFQGRPPEMDIKWGFVDFYLLVSTFEPDYDLRGREDDFTTFYVSLEQERRAVDDPADLIGSDHDAWDRDLYDYIEAFQREGGKRPNIETRHAVYTRRALRDIPDLVPKDPTRAFTRDQRLVIWRRDGESCQECGRPVAFEEMQADHVLPHARGGTTVVENGQSLCGECNRRKGGTAQQEVRR